MKLVAESLKEYLINEDDRKPLEGMCGVTIDGVNYDFKVKDIIKFAEDNYKPKDTKLSDVYKLSLFKDLDSDHPNKKDHRIKIGGKWCSGDKMTDEQWKKFQREQKEIAIKANLKYPILLTVDKNGKIMTIIDGNHRVEKAKMLHHDLIEAYYIPEEDIVKSFPKSKKQPK